MKSDDELKQDNPELYHIAREAGTEPRGKGAYVDTTEHGVYHCALCGAELFNSNAKFASTSGWPSFTDPIGPGTLTLHHDWSQGFDTIEVRCKECNAHLGHLFKGDGITVDGIVSDRYCINSISLDLAPE